MKLKLLLMLLALGMCSIGANAQKREHKVEKDGFEWYEIADKDWHYGAEDKNGKLIVPLGDYYISYNSFSLKYFEIRQKGGKGKGVYNLRGKCIIPLSRNYTSVFGTSNYRGSYYEFSKEDGRGVCDINGKEVCFIKDIEYLDLEYQKGKLFYTFKKNGKWGVMDGNKKVLCPAKWQDMHVQGNYIQGQGNSGKWINIIALSSITTRKNPLMVEEDLSVNHNDSYASSNNSSSSGSSSSSSSLASSRGSSTSSSSTSSGNTWKHRGWYLESTDGIDIYTGRRMSENGAPSGIIKMQFTVYDDHIEVATETDVKNGNALKISYSGMENGWRVYRSVSGSGSWRMNQRYYVSSNYDIKYIMNDIEFPIVKEGENIFSYRKISSGQNGGYSSGYNGGSYGGSTGGSSGSSSGNSSKPQYTKTCRVCHGSGTCNNCGGRGWVSRIGMGKDGPCPVCPNHNGRCSSCGGRGSWKE